MESQQRIARKIDETRITYDNVGHGTRINGTAFKIDLDEKTDPEDRIDEMATAEEPWEMFAVYNQIGEDYYSAACVLYHVEDGGIDHGTKLDLEVAPGWFRVYVKGEEADENRIAEFVETVLDEFGGEVRFA